MDTIHLPPDFREFIQFIDSARVEYLLVGGYAVAFHGAPRFTSDMDVWVGAEPENIKNLGQALADFGFRDPEIISGQFFKSDTVFRIGAPPLQIDVLAQISDCNFGDCYARREVLQREGITISLISREDLLRNKRASGRAKDLGDLEALTDQE